MGRRIRSEVVRVTPSERRFIVEVRRQVTAGEHGVERARAEARLAYLLREAAAVEAEIEKLDRLIERASVRELVSAGVPIKDG